MLLGVPLIPRLIVGLFTIIPITLVIVWGSLRRKKFWQSTCLVIQSIEIR
jgi:hypothetical protein